MSTDKPVRFVLDASVEGAPEDLIHEDGSPKVADIVLTQSLLQVLETWAEVLRRRGTGTPTRLLFDITSDRATAFAFPSFRGGAEAYTTTGTHAEFDPLTGHEEASKGAAIQLRADSEGGIHVRLLATPEHDGELGVLMSEEIELELLWRLHSAAVALGVPFAFSEQGLAKARDFDLLDPRDPDDFPPNYSAYDAYLAATTSFEDIEDAAVAVLNVATPAAGNSRARPATPAP